MRATPQRNSHSYNRAPRPKTPQFIQETAEDLTEQTSQGIPYADYLVEYRALGGEFQAVMSFIDFCHLQLKSKPKIVQKALRQNNELQKTLGKVTIPFFLMGQPSAQLVHGYKNWTHIFSCNR